MGMGLEIKFNEAVPEGQIWFINKKGVIIVRIVEEIDIKPDDTVKNFLVAAKEILERHS